MDKSFKLPIGIEWDGRIIDDAIATESNGVCERVFLKKFPEKPFTYLASICTIGLMSIDDIQIGSLAQKQFLKNNVVDISPVVRKMTMADMNSCATEIHRRSWNSQLPMQKTACIECGHSFYSDIDLSKIEMDEESLIILDNKDTILHPIAKLSRGFVYTPPQSMGGGGDGLASEYAGKTINAIKFRAPTVNDALKYEPYISDSVVFWRKVALDCIEEFMYINENGDVDITFPTVINRVVRSALLESLLNREDLVIVRKTVRDLPSLPFDYNQTCPSCGSQTPVSVEAQNFFSE